MDNYSPPRYVTIDRREDILTEDPRVYHIAYDLEGRVGIVRALCGRTIDLHESGIEEHTTPPDSTTIKGIRKPRACIPCNKVFLDG